MSHSDAPEFNPTEPFSPPRIDFSRRRFIKTFALGSAVSSLAGRSWFATVLGDCQPVEAGAGILKVKVGDFPALAAQNGSVRLAINSFTQNGPNGPFYPVLVNRGANDQFFTLRSRCTHEGCVVPIPSRATGISVCPCHQSRYAIDGSVVTGPAGGDLTQYVNSFDGTVLCIEIPNLGYSITSATVDAATSQRLTLKFVSFRTSQYQVLFRKSTADPGTVVAIATTPTGAVTTTPFTATGTASTLYVERTEDTGFYVVAIVVNAR